MAKRFTDTDKWKKPFIKGLQAPYKLLWFYILDDCDHAGIWIVDLEVAGLRCGFDYDEKDVLKNFNGQVEVLKGGTVWFIRDFIEFQYGDLNPANRAHNSVINRLNKYKIKPLTSPLKGAKDKDKDKDMDMDKEQDKDIPSFDVFLAYAVSKEPNIDHSDVKRKYNLWVENDWRDGYDKPINRWKAKLINTLPHLKKVKPLEVLTYSEAKKLPDKEERIRYCKLKGIPETDYRYGNIVHQNEVAF